MALISIVIQAVGKILCDDIKLNMKQRFGNRESATDIIIQGDHPSKVDLDAFKRLHSSCTSSTVTALSK